ncbi:MAG TPA: hypothetical protein PLW86_19060 [Rhodocyclaceae bacterium]|nr:hypothetical protein [Rhodocyclaceae bacterium]
MTAARLLCLLLAAQIGSAAAACGEVFTLASHDNTTTRYSIAKPPANTRSTAVLVLLAGGGGALDLDAQGCPQALTGNSLVRSVPLFNALGLTTVLVDAPSDYPGEDGLKDFRAHPKHAADLGALIGELRSRSSQPVWLAGTSRGTISAANVAARLTGSLAPDGVILTSALMVGQTGARKAWVAQTVFDLPLEAIRIPLLLIGHEADACTRSPASEMPRLAARLSTARQQIVTVRGGPAVGRSSGLEACEGKSPHGYFGQEEEVANGIARFIRGEAY